MPLAIEKMIEDYEQNNKSQFEENYQGKKIGLEYVVHMNKKEASVFQFNVINPKEEST